MAMEWLSIGSRWNRRVYLGAAAVISAAGCQSTERDDSFSSLDARTRQMLLAPAGGTLKAPAQQYAVTDPTMTGATGVTPGNSFNRGMMGAQPSYASQNDSKSQNSYAVMPNTTGMVQGVGIGAPSMPPTGGNLQLQSKVQQAQFTTPVNPAPTYNGPPVNVIGTVPPVAPTQPASAISTMQPQGLAPLVQPIPATQIQPQTNTITGIAPPVQPPIAVPPAAMPMVSEMPAPALPTQIANVSATVPVAAPTPAAPETPKLTGGFVPLASPVDQPPTGFGPLPAGPLK
jgi:hypothetical protein